ncbi:hypothetical protein WMY93_018820 [Mugilogobius chulae]|uniref:Uncharacterized protein n=1 Tax=Mugilogobius chulae TaxID=88201 RepID=A0AAW0NRW4_9GOBI
MINMRAVLCGAVLLGTIQVCFTQQVSLLPPVRLRFDSVDYKTTAVWNPPSNSSSLKYYLWRASLADVHHCQGIEKPRCDLSEVTSDITEWYYARVQATSSDDKSPWTISRRFSPRWDSKISPPLLRLNTTEKGIVVRVKPPRSQVRKNHRDLFYKIYVMRENGEEEELKMDCCFHKLSVKHVKSKAKYCFQAQTILPLQARNSRRSETKCIALKGIKYPLSLVRSRSVDTERKGKRNSSGRNPSCSISKVDMGFFWDFFVLLTDFCSSLPSPLPHLSSLKMNVRPRSLDDDMGQTHLYN